MGKERSGTKSQNEKEKKNKASAHRLLRSVNVRCVCPSLAEQKTGSGATARQSPNPTLHRSPPPCCWWLYDRLIGFATDSLPRSPPPANAVPLRAAMTLSSGLGPNRILNASSVAATRSAPLARHKDCSTRCCVILAEVRGCCGGTRDEAKGDGSARRDGAWIGSGPDCDCDSGSADGCAGEMGPRELVCSRMTVAALATAAVLFAFAASIFCCNFDSGLPGGALAEFAAETSAV